MFEKRKLESLTVDSFQPYTGQEFFIGNSSQPIGLRLISANSSKNGSLLQEIRAPFMLMFKSAARQILAQGTYCLVNEHFGEIEIFIVPVKQEADGITYQAVFN